MAHTSLSEQTHDIPPIKCPLCKYKMDSSTGIGCDTSPKVGDITLCLNCGAILEFDELMFVLPASFEKMLELDSSTRKQIENLSGYIKKRGEIKNIKEYKPEGA